MLVGRWSLMVRIYDVVLVVSFGRTCWQAGSGWVFLLLDAGYSKALIAKILFSGLHCSEPRSYPIFQSLFRLILQFADSNIHWHRDYGRRARFLPFYTLVCQATE